jgi:transposase
MGEAHPIELRRRVVERYEAGGHSYADISAQFSIGEATVKRWVWRFRQTGSLVPTPKGGGTPSTIMAEEIERLLADGADATAGELTAALNRQRTPRRRVHVSSMKRALHRHGYVVKKSADGRWRYSGLT